MRKRIVSILAALALCLGLLPGAVLAAEEAGETEETEKIEEAEETEKEGSPQLLATPVDISIMGVFVFAQGVPIVIRENGGITSIYDTEGNLLTGDTDVSGFLIYGGWYGNDTHSANTSVTMESGRVLRILGGSYLGVLNGDTHVVIRGGSVYEEYNGNIYGTVYGGGTDSEVTGTANVTFYGGDVKCIYGGGNSNSAANACANTHVKFMGQVDQYVEIYGGSNSGTVGTAVVEFHGNGAGVICAAGSGWYDRVEEARLIVGEACEPPADPAYFCARNPFDETSAVGTASFEVHLDGSRPSMMNSSGLNGTGVTGDVTATIYGDATTDQIFETALTEIDRLVVESGTFSLRTPMTLDRLEVKDSGTVVIPASGGTTAAGTLAGSGTLLLAKGTGSPDIVPITVDAVEVPDGSRIKIGYTGSGLADSWKDAVVLQGSGIQALDSAACFSSQRTGYYLAKTADGSGIQVMEGTEQKAASIDPVPTFDKPSYRYGETMRITMGLKAEGLPVPGQLLEVRGGAGGTQTFATAETDANGLASFTLPVDDNLWASRETGLQAMFHGTEGYKEAFYGISLVDGSGAMDYIVTGAQVTLEGEITAPVRDAVPVESLAAAGDAVCTAQVLWSPADAAFRPEVAYTASIRLVPKPGYSLDGGRLGSVTWQGQPLSLPGGTEVDGSVVIPNVKVFAPIPIVHVTGVSLNKTALTLTEGDSEQLLATVAPGDAEDKTVTWTSSDPSVATVDGSGNVTAAGEGTATIAVTTTDGGKTAVCTVTVNAGGGGSNPSDPSDPGNPGNSGNSGSSGSSDSSGGSSPAVTVEGSSHGKVTSNCRTASRGDTVTLTVVPDRGYILSALTVTDSRGGRIGLTDQGGGRYTFLMPGRAVRIRATFAPLPADTEQPCDGGAGCPSRSFADLGTAGTWYHEAVDHALRNGLMSGYGSGLFGPNDPLTRAQLVRILHNCEGRPVVNYLMRFEDVPGEAWYAEAVRWAASRGIAGGYDGGRRFGPQDHITREQLAVMLWRYAGSPAAAGEPAFTDADAIGGYAVEALRWAVEKGIVSGYGDGRLAPREPVTRAQAAQMLMRFLSSR